MRVPLLAANWKMNKTVPDALAFAGAFVPQMLEVTGGAEWPEILVCPPFTAIPALAAAFSSYPIKIGAQNLYWQEKGAFTGEVSPSMLRDAGCSYVIVGHSERRHLFGETDEMAQKKVRAALDNGLRPVLCVGETLEQREKGRALEVVGEMTRLGLSAAKPADIDNVVIAYEPVWAIGTGKEAKPDDAREVIAHIRKTVSEVLGEVAGEAVRVLYGGSVKAGNIRSFIAHEEIDGALIGGASLDPGEFAKMVLEVRKGRAQP
ncbi:MAG: triose-phosphate isomerase [Bacillota bacterium]